MIQGCMKYLKFVHSWKLLKDTPWIVSEENPPIFNVTPTFQSGLLDSFWTLKICNRPFIYALSVVFNFHTLRTVHQVWSNSRLNSTLT